MEYGKVNVNVNQGASHMRPHSKRTDNRRRRSRVNPILITALIAIILIIAGVVIYLVIKKVP